MKNLIRNIIILGILTFIFFIFFPDAERDSQGQIVSEGSLSINNLRIGDCFNQKELNDESEYELFEEVEALPCDRLHDFEVYAINQNAFEQQSSFDMDSMNPVEFCLTEYSNFKGISTEEVYKRLFQDEESEIVKSIYFSPSSETWAKGDRKVTCAVYKKEN
jgi:hypothetical protein